MLCKYIAQSGRSWPIICDKILLRRMKLALRFDPDPALPPERFECDKAAAELMTSMAAMEPGATLHPMEPGEIGGMSFAGRTICVIEDARAP